eukprot:sb/3472515/
MDRVPHGWLLVTGSTTQRGRLYTQRTTITMIMICLGLHTCIVREVPPGKQPIRTRYLGHVWLSANQGPVFPDSVCSWFLPPTCRLNRTESRVKAMQMKQRIPAIMAGIRHDASDVDVSFALSTQLSNRPISPLLHLVHTPLFQYSLSAQYTQSVLSSVGIIKSGH